MSFVFGTQRHAAEFELSCVRILLSLLREFLHVPGVRQANALGQRFAGRDVDDSGMAALQVLAKFNSTPTPSGS